MFSLALPIEEWFSIVMLCSEQIRIHYCKHYIQRLLFPFLLLEYSSGSHTATTSLDIFGKAIKLISIYPMTKIENTKSQYQPLLSNLWKRISHWLPCYGTDNELGLLTIGVICQVSHHLLEVLNAAI